MMNKFNKRLGKAVYPKKYIGELEKEAKNVKEKIANGEQKVFSSTEEMYKELDDEEED